MTTDALQASPARQNWHRAGVVIPALVIGLVVLGLLFRGEAAAAVRVWSESTAYGHCYFIIPISLFLAWERRFAVQTTPVHPLPLAALLALPLGAVWLLVERLGIMEGQQIMAMGFVELLFLVVLGWRMWWVLAVPLLYLGFLVPFGAFITPALQRFTAVFVIHGLDLLGIANISDGFTIEIPEGTFFVAEACAGLRFLIASIAFGVLYACMIYRSPLKRVLFIGASVLIPIIANGFRGLGIVTLGHILGSAQAATVDHVVYGWIFFSIVILLLILAGLPFREDGEPVPAAANATAGAAPTPRAVAWAASVVLLLSAAAPALAGWFDFVAEMGPPLMTANPGSLNGCVPTPPVAAGNGGSAWRYSCTLGGQPYQHLQLAITAFPARANPGAIVRAQHAAIGDLGAEDTEVHALRDSEAARWQLATTTEPNRLTATAIWIDGKPATGGMSQRWLQARNSVFGGDAAAVLVTISTPVFQAGMTADLHRNAQTAIETLLNRNPQLPREITDFAATVAHSTGS
jgi:exosortase A